MGTAEIKDGILNDAVFMGVRASVGVIFILHGMGKFNPGFANALPNMGLPPELQIPIALAEVVPGILLIIGVLSRFSGALLAIVMVGAIFHVKGAQSMTGDGGVEFDVILLAASLLIMVAGPGRIAIAQAARRIPRILH
ncbi:MAG: DoxX family protein [Thaumarchaeota archaeon]|nr:DoxX family protein [Nitrososphaerota archaeon]MDE0267304.1 DoxX family protein [Nitrososphaerota archaeon]MDE0526073.1 DoxX family protein [Nitrososphaerota archaeon]